MARIKEEQEEQIKLEEEERVRLEEERLRLEQEMLDLLSIEELQDLQIEELKSEADEIFQTADKGSEQYQKGLDILAEAAKVDDIKVSPELASAPVVGDIAIAVVNVINAIDNFGADMSPEVREDSEEVVVAAVIVGGVAQLASGPAAAASAVRTRIRG